MLEAAKTDRAWAWETQVLQGWEALSWNQTLVQGFSSGCDSQILM
jgi:hypothetical protein